MRPPAVRQPRLRRPRLVRVGVVAGVAIAFVLAFSMVPDRVRPDGSGTGVDVPDTDELPTTTSGDDLPARFRVRSEDRVPPAVTCEGGDSCLGWAHRFEEGRDDAARTFATVAADHGLVVVQEHTRLLALDLEDGTVVWERSVDPERRVASRRGWVLDEAALLVVVTDLGARPQELRAYALEDGSAVWGTFKVDRIDDVWLHEGLLRVLGARRPDDRATVHTYEPRTGVVGIPSGPVVTAAGDGNGEVVLDLGGTLTHRSAGGEAWQVTGVAGHRLDLDEAAVMVSVTGADGGLDVTWYDRPTGTELGRWTDHDGVDRPGGSDPNARSRALPSGEAAAARLGPDGDLEVVISHFGETVHVDDLADDAALVLGAGVLLRRQSGDDPRHGTLEIVDLDTGEARTVHDVTGEVRTGADVAHDQIAWPPTGRADAEVPWPDAALALAGWGTTLVDLPTGEVVWRTDMAVRLVDAPDRDVLVWPGGVLRVVRG